MLTNNLLEKIEPLLKKQIRDYYNKEYDFKPGSFGDYILQASRIAIFQILINYHGPIEEIFEDNHQREAFFQLVKSELKEANAQLSFFPSLDAPIKKGEDGTLVDLLEKDNLPKNQVNEDYKITAFSIEDLRQILSGQELHIATVLGQDRLIRLIQTEDQTERAERLTKGINQIINTLDKGDGRKYHNLSRVYAEGLAKIYEQIRSGEIKNWRSLSKGNVPFFDWDMHLKERNISF